MATSKLQREVSQLLSTHLGQYTIRENKRPDWLALETGEWLELDFYIEEPKIAIEVQGQQHYAYTPHFHRTYADFEAQLFRDREEKRLCKNRGVTLYEVVSLDEALEIATKLCPEILRPIHPKAEKEYMQIYQKMQRRKEEEEVIRSSKRNYEHRPKTIRKHLAKIHKIVIKIWRGYNPNDKDKSRIDNGLRAIQQYQSKKGAITFSIREKILLDSAGIILKLNKCQERQRTGAANRWFFV